MILGHGLEEETGPLAVAQGAFRRGKVPASLLRPCVISLGRGARPPDCADPPTKVQCPAPSGQYFTIASRIVNRSNLAEIEFRLADISRPSSRNRLRNLRHHFLVQIHQVR